MAQSSSHKSPSWQTAALCCLIFCLLVTIESHANPIEEWPQGSKTSKPQTVSECGPRGDVETESLCQRCAKSTKSDVVYPMCCEDREEVRQWCQKYMAYGIQ